MDRLSKLQEKNKYIGDVRGLGFMIGVEFVKNKETKEPFGEMAQKIKSEMFNRGVLIHTCGHYANVIRFMAPLTIEQQLLDKSLDIFAGVVDNISKSN
jgi:4-aminobutyrate aminotransferase-like enzyme